MPKKCIIQNCRLASDDPGCLALSFFRAPKDESRRQAWQDSINTQFNTRIVLRDYSCLCATHFTEDCFKIGQRVTLQKTAVPTIFSDYPTFENGLITSSIPGTTNPVHVKIRNQSEKSSYYSDQLTAHALDSPSLEMDIDDTNVNDADDSSHLHSQDSQNNLEEQPFSEDEVYASIARQLNSDRHRSKSFSKKLLRKSIVNIDLKSVDLNDKELVFKLLQKAQKEVYELRKTTKSKTSLLNKYRKIEATEVHDESIIYYF